MKAKFECPKCHEVQSVTFSAGQKPEAPKCEKCDEMMIRKFNVSLGDVVSDDMLHFGQDLLYK